MSTAPRSPDVSDALARVEALLTGSSGPRGAGPVQSGQYSLGVPGAGLDADTGNTMRHARLGPRLRVSVLEAWRADGLIEVMLTPLSIDDDGQVTPAQHLFWVPRNARAAWLSRIETEDGRDRLAALARDIRAASSRNRVIEHMPTATWRWAVVASHALGTGAHRRCANRRARVDRGPEARTPGRGLVVDRGAPAGCRDRAGRGHDAAPACGAAPRVVRPSAQRPRDAA